MFLREFYEPLRETVLRLPYKEGEKRPVYVTQKFLDSFEKYRGYSAKDIPAALAAFLNRKVEVGMQPVGNKDAPLTGLFSISGVWRAHLHIGKVILIYSPAVSHLELYGIVEHNAIEGMQSHRHVEQLLVAATPDTLRPWTWTEEQAPPEFTEAHFDDITGWVYTLIDNEADRASMRQFVHVQKGEFVEFLTGWAAEAMPDLPPETAVREFLLQWEKHYRTPFSKFVSQALG